MPRTVIISGLGLMGGSLAGAARAAGWRVLLQHRRPEPVAEAVQRGWGEALGDPAGCGADLAVVCTPVEHIAATVRQLAATTSSLITDVGSVKGGLCTELSDLAGRFVGSHPMCGSHLQGVANADPAIYRGATTIVTPSAATPPAALALVEGFWAGLGCRLVRLAPADHDRAVAAASHLPHILANAAARQLTDEAAPLCAGGFRDVTRVAGAGAALWTGILLANRHEAAAAARRAAADLQALAAALDGDDQPAVAAWLAGGRAGRARYDAAKAG